MLPRGGGTGIALGKFESLQHEVNGANAQPRLAGVRMALVVLS